MNTYIQDTTIPIYIMIQYEGNIMKFPINPEKLSVDIPSGSHTDTIEGLGQIGIPNYPELKKIQISSFFWSQVNLISSSVYVSWLENWQKSKKPASLIVTRLNYNFTVTCENFSYETRAGEEEDIYFTLDLQEYRKYGAKRLGDIDTGKNLLEKLSDKVSSITSSMPSILFEIPRLNRLSIMKTVIKSPYTSQLNDTLTGITQKITGSTKKWKELYNLNKDKIVDNEIPVGTSLLIPESWNDSDDINVLEL